jgi:hypothetical protein
VLYVLDTRYLALTERTTIAVMTNTSREAEAGMQAMADEVRKAATATNKFSVGDRVRLVSTYGVIPKGTEGKVTHDDTGVADYVQVIFFGEDSNTEGAQSVRVHYADIEKV